MNVSEANPSTRVGGAECRRDHVYRTLLTMRGSTKTKTTIIRPMSAIGFFRIHPIEMSAGF